MVRLPRGRVAGCLPRESRVGENCPMFSSKIETIPRREWSKYEGKISLEPLVTEIFDQGQVGSCAAESSVQALQICRAMAGQPFVGLNPYSVYHSTSSGRDRGSSIDVNLRYLREHGCCPEDLWPREKGWRERPSEEAMRHAKRYRILEFYDIETVEEMVTALLKGFPVVYGANGHAVCKISHLNDSKGLDVNSWGEGWGDDGMGVWAEYRHIGWNYGAFAVRTTATE